MEDRAAPLIGARLKAIRKAIDAAPDFPAAARGLLELAAKWTPLALGQMMSDALDLASLMGREAAFMDGEEPGFADGGPDVFKQSFKERIAYFEQKRPAPTKSFTDLRRGTHDRSFVIAGATDTAMLSDFQSAIAKAMREGTTIETFRADFDRIVARYGWQYKGDRGWRTRLIFETNIRTSYMAGRLKQMRDPAVIKLRPIWEYRHGETRTPRSPRPRHEAWHGKCLRHDDPWWSTHYPPNGYFCSCGVRSLSLRDLKRKGKDKPDAAPEDLFEPTIDAVSGALTERAAGIQWGWDYMPGDLWERGLTPSRLVDEGAELLDDPRHAVTIDTPSPIEDLLKAARPFKARAMNEGLEPEAYVRAFLKPFGGDIGKAVLFEDKAGTKVPVSDLLFRDRKGELKVMKGSRATLVPLLAEALLDPDEIWIGVARKKNAIDKNEEELVVDRRYIRTDRKSGLMIVFEIGERLWEAITAHNISKPNGAIDLKALNRRRGGKLVYKRPG